MIENVLVGLLLIIGLATTGRLLSAIAPIGNLFDKVFAKIATKVKKDWRIEEKEEIQALNLDS